MCRPVHFEGDLFTGKAILWTKGVPSQPKHLFKGQRRKSSITVQGRFKRPVVMSHFVTGPEFTRPFVNLPAKWFVEGVLLRVSLVCTCLTGHIVAPEALAVLSHLMALTFTHMHYTLMD